MPLIDRALNLVYSDDRPIEDIISRLANWTGLFFHRGYDLSNRFFYEARVFGLSLEVEKKTSEIVSLAIGFGYGEEDLQSIQVCLLYCLFQIVYKRLEIKEAQILKGKQTIADYFTRDRVLYDLEEIRFAVRISEKPVIEPDHLLDLYLRIK